MTSEILFEEILFCVSQLKWLL